MVYNNLLMQFLADTLNVPVIRPKVTETTAWALLMPRGWQSGFGPILHNCAKTGPRTIPGCPLWHPAIREKGYRDWKKAVERTLNWVDEAGS